MGWEDVVILSAAKNLRGVSGRVLGGNKILRCAQNDTYPMNGHPTESP
jgi:hypothetical protein